MKLGIICPSEIAYRRFMPALQKCEGLTFAGLGVFTREELFGGRDMGDREFAELRRAEEEKAARFTAQYGGRIYDSYEAVVTAPEIDAVYLPLPPALHYRWALEALEHGKHVLAEKPATLSLADSRSLVEAADRRGLALHENYMFAFHSQIEAIRDMIRGGEIGEVRLYRIAFGFPRRAANDFRYNRALGGGALIDAGGYTIRFASDLLGPTARLRYAQMNRLPGDEVDMYGSAAMVNDEGVTAQLAYGMDNSYKCELEVWGSLGCLTTGRILTAPDGFEPTVTIRKAAGDEVIRLPADDAFAKSIAGFAECARSAEARKRRYEIILRQAALADEFRALAAAEEGRTPRA